MVPVGSVLVEAETAEHLAVGLQARTLMLDYSPERHTHSDQIHPLMVLVGRILAAKEVPQRHSKVELSPGLGLSGAAEPAVCLAAVSHQATFAVLRYREKRLGSRDSHSLSVVAGLDSEVHAFGGIQAVTSRILTAACRIVSVLGERWARREFVSR